VEDVLLLLAVTLGLVKSLDDEGSSRGDDLDGGDTVLDDELNGDTETLVGLGGSGDIIGNLLGRKTEGTDLGGKGGSTSGLTTETTEGD
jgi:hypothetical protein